MDLNTFNDLFRDYRIAAMEWSDGTGSLSRKHDAELAVLMAAKELSERRTAIPSVINYNLLASVKEMLHYYAPGAQEGAERNGEDSLHSAVRNARRAVREAEAAEQPVIIAEQQKSTQPIRMLTSEEIAESRRFSRPTSEDE